MNMGEIAYNDIHLSHMAQELRYGFYGDIDWAILEVCDIEEDGDIVKAYLTAAGGISPTVARLAKHVILELNAFHSKDANYCTTFMNHSIRQCVSLFLLLTLATV